MPGGANRQAGCARAAPNTFPPRGFFVLHAQPKSELAAQALTYFGALYDVERERAQLSAGERGERREARGRQTPDGPDSPGGCICGRLTNR
ncbi:IS66 family transposase [Pandoraea sputorum]|uniref:IS66 family transposase n=1 Tax=Pandoraea sputorum TaxID=93222 RepID=A0A5E5BIX5_9BURK|nr:IS66 family transposase [Pandoraea sputorum]